MTSDAFAVLFEHPTPKVRRRELRHFLIDLGQQIAKGRGIVCLIAGDQRLRELNRRFRGKDYATDVLSFPGETGGELAISFDRAVAQARDLGHSVEEELRILMLHGALHLSGMDHETDAGQMRRAERRWRKRFGLPAGLIERTQRAA